MSHASRRARAPDPADWHPDAAGAGDLKSWLETAGSLTLRIAARCTADAPFSVRVLKHVFGRPERDEANVLSLPAGRIARVREVLLLAGAKPLVFAHSVVAPAHLRRPWVLMDRVGGRALGSVLFADPVIARGPLYYRRIDQRHPLYHRAGAWSSVPLRGQLWARRAAFRINERPLLVTEVFLPAILDLKP